MIISVLLMNYTIFNTMLKLQPLQYLTNPAQEVQAVVIGIDDWEKIQAQLLAYEEHLRLYEDLKTAFEEVKEFREGTKTARKAIDILDEL